MRGENTHVPLVFGMHSRGPGTSCLAQTVPSFVVLRTAAEQLPSMMLSCVFLSSFLVAAPKLLLLSSQVHILASEL